MMMSWKSCWPGAFLFKSLLFLLTFILIKKVVELAQNGGPDINLSDAHRSPITGIQ